MQLTEPDEALKQIESISATQRTILVDFDETLWLRNSTEAYLATMRPAYLAGLVLWLLDIVPKMAARVPGLPPRFFANGTMDWLRVCLCTALMPWTYWRWRKRAATDGAAHINHQLINALSGARGSVIISSLGFSWIIQPLLASAYAGTPATQWRLIASRGVRDRLRGKAQRLDAALSPSEAIETACVITDSAQDRAVLERSEYPVYVRWPGARYERAHTEAYLPLWYTTRIKRPNARYLRRGIVLDDGMFWLLALPMASLGLATVTGLALLLLSFWAAYEIGYRENDKLGEQRESNPRLTRAYLDGHLREGPVAAWIWCALASVLGLAVLTAAGATYQVSLGALVMLWTCLIVATRATFFLFNRLPKRRRIWLFPVLQAARAFAPTSVLVVSPAGQLALLAHTIARSLPYLAYRLQPTTEYPKPPVASIRTALFLALAMCAAALDPSWALWTQTEFWVLAAWCAFRMWREAANALRRSTEKAV